VRRSLATCSSARLQSTFRCPKVLCSLESVLRGLVLVPPTLPLPRSLHRCVELVRDTYLFMIFSHKKELRVTVVGTACPFVVGRYCRRPEPYYSCLIIPAPGGQVLHSGVPWCRGRAPRPVGVQCATRRCQRGRAPSAQPQPRRWTVVPLEVCPFQVYPSRFASVTASISSCFDLHSLHFQVTK
jgi:hypothetical protein